MKKLLLLLIVFGFAGQSWGQEKKASDEDRKKGEEVFTELNLIFSKYKQLYDVEEEALNVLKQKLNSSADNELIAKIEKQLKTAKAYKDTLAVRQELFNNYNGVYLDKGLTVEEIAGWYKYTSENFEKSKAETNETKVFTYFGENKVIDNDILKNKTGVEAEIFRDVLANKGEDSYLGDITIPKDGQEFKFYEYKSNEPSESKTFKFKKLEVEISDGYFKDIIVYVEDKDKNTHVFTNQIGVSLLFYDHKGKRKLMYYKYSIKKNATDNLLDKYSDENLAKLYIRLTDVMSYSYRIGNNYIPSDLALKLPNKDTDNLQSNATYEIKQKTYLEKILELRTYTDFLALFGDSDNGLAQIEGKAKFYLFPYPFRFLGSKKTLGQVEYLSSISPFVNYSKFDTNSRYINSIKDIDGLYQFVRNFDFIEKRFLTMGVEGEIVKLQNKNGPVQLSLYGLINYNISEINIGTDEERVARNIKAMGYGGGLQLSTKRFNNFGFDYKAELSWYNYKNFNEDTTLVLPGEIPVFKNEAEIFYHPNGNPNQAIFTRLITYNYMGTSNDQAFYQFQFGYKFAIGNRTVN